MKDRLNPITAKLSFFSWKIHISSHGSLSKQPFKLASHLRSRGSFTKSFFPNSACSWLSAATPGKRPAKSCGVYRSGTVGPPVTHKTNSPPPLLAPPTARGVFFAALNSEPYPQVQCSQSLTSLKPGRKPDRYFNHRLALRKPLFPPPRSPLFASSARRLKRLFSQTSTHSAMCRDGHGVRRRAGAGA